MTDKIRIKEVCKEKGMTLEQLAERMGILRTSLSQAMNRNNFSIDKLNEIAGILNIPVWQLFVSPKDITSDNTLMALVKYGDGFYSANTLDGLKEIVSTIEKKNGGC